MGYDNSIDKIKFIYETAQKGLVEFFGIFNNNQKEYVQPAYFHYMISDVLLKSNEHFAIQAFRESGKTSLILSYPKYMVCFPKESVTYIVIIKQNHTLAESKVKELSNEIQTNPFFSCFIQEIVKDSGPIFCAKVKGYNGVEVELRIEGYGKGSPIRGLSYKDRRPDIVILDDIQDMNDMYSPITLEKDYEWFIGEVMFLGKNSRIFLIGNNLGEKCVIERIVNVGEKIGFKCMKIPALENNKPTWPAKYSIEYLLKEKNTYREEGKLDVWYRERMCESISDETRVFSRMMFKYFNEKDEDIAEEITKSNIYILWDAAISEERNACYSAFVVCAVSYKNNIFVLDVEFGKYNIDDAVNILFMLVKKYKNRCSGSFEVYIEREKLSTVFKNVVLNRQKYDNTFFFFDEVKPDKSKEARIMGLQPRFRSGSIYFREDANWLSEIEGELLMFPRGKKLDVIDALAYIEYVGKPYYEIDNDILKEFERISFSPL